MLLNQLRKEICKLHAELPRNNLVTWTSGNISGRDPESGLVVIKPSGVRYSELTPENMVVVNLEGQVVEGSLKPSMSIFTAIAPMSMAWCIRIQPSPLPGLQLAGPSPPC